MTANKERVRVLQESTFFRSVLLCTSLMIVIESSPLRGKSEGTGLPHGRSVAESAADFWHTIGATMIGTGSSMGAISMVWKRGSTYGLGCALALVLIGVLFSKMRDYNFITMAEEAQFYFDGSP